MWWILLAAYEVSTLIFWRRVLPDEKITIGYCALALLLSWILSPIAAVTMLIVYIAEKY